MSFSCRRLQICAFEKNILKVGMNPAYEFSAAGAFLTGLQGIADRSGTRI